MKKVSWHFAFGLSDCPPLLPSLPSLQVYCIFSQVYKGKQHEMHVQHFKKIQHGGNFTVGLLTGYQ